MDHDGNGTNVQYSRNIEFEGKNNYGAYDYEFPFGDQPLYVNSKQLNWIKKRKSRRDMLDSLMINSRNGYLHESRHRHAMKRLRASSGRFLTKKETEDFYKRDGGR